MMECQKTPKKFHLNKKYSTQTIIKRLRGFTESHVWIVRIACVDYLNCLCGLTEPFL